MKDAAEKSIEVLTKGQVGFESGSVFQVNCYLDEEVRSEVT